MLGTDAFAEVGPGNHFFGCAHTQERYTTAFYQPFLSDWRNFESWQEAGIKGLEMEKITGSIAFSIASTIDDTSGVEVDGVEVRPYLTFRDDDDTLIHSGDNSYIYEFVPSELKRLFDV